MGTSEKYGLEQHLPSRKFYTKVTGHLFLQFLNQTLIHAMALLQEEIPKGHVTPEGQALRLMECAW